MMARPFAARALQGFTKGVRMTELLRRKGRAPLLLLLALVGFAVAAAHAQVVPAPQAPQIGSSNPVTAAPPVSRPAGVPCVVPLFKNLEFANYTPKTFSYSPPAACPGPWEKVVFTADFTVTAGNQFDRTAAFYIGQANIYFGTTAEPRATLSPAWHVERDVTDLSALFTSSQSGEANLGNFVGVYQGVTYNGIIYADAALEFYPARRAADVPRTADIIVPVEGSSGDAATLSSGASQLTATLNLPRNVERAYLDVIAQSQSNDEFWYFCVPNDETSNLESCGNTSFRETEITIDGMPAGVAPVYPWIYTGGIDPFLWEPIPGVQTLDFVPYRVDLTPFAGLLDDGKPHVLALSVFNADSWFSASANLLVFTDHGAQRLSGGLLSNTLGAAPAPVVKENIHANAAAKTFNGTVSVTSGRQFTISGYVDTSHGRVLTTVDQSVSFQSTQEFNVSPSTDIQNVQQLTSVDSRVHTLEGFRDHTYSAHFSYPLNINYAYVVAADGSASQKTSVEQADEVQTGADLRAEHWLQNRVRAADTLSWDASGNLLGPSGASTTQTYRSGDAAGACWSRTLSAQNQKLTAVNDQGCP
jgi:hypothetical protein